MPRLSIEFPREWDALGDAFGVVISQEYYDEANFGDARLILEGPHIRFRVLRDWSQILLDVAKPQGDWLEFSTVLDALELAEYPSPDMALTDLVNTLTSRADQTLRTIAA